MKKLIFLALCMIIMSTVLVGCGESQRETNNSSSKAPITFLSDENLSKYSKGNATNYHDDQLVFINSKFTSYIIEDTEKTYQSVRFSLIDEKGFTWNVLSMIENLDSDKLNALKDKNAVFYLQCNKLQVDTTLGNTSPVVSLDEIHIGTDKYNSESLKK